MEVKNRPELFGKQIDHKMEGWFRGTVTAILNENEFDTDCECNGYDEPILVELIKDWKEGKVKILPDEEEQGDVLVGRKQASGGTEKQPKTKKERNE